jgi:hypothetical protein
MIRAAGLGKLSPVCAHGSEQRDIGCRENVIGWRTEVIAEEEVQLEAMDCPTWRQRVEAVLE